MKRFIFTLFFAALLNSPASAQTPKNDHNDCPPLKNTLREIELRIASGQDAAPLGGRAIQEAVFCAKAQEAARAAQRAAGGK